MRLADGYGVTLDVLVRFTIEDGDIRGVPLSGAERELLESRRAATAARLGRNRERATRRDGADR